MKKLFLFVTMLSLSLVSCSDDDSNPAQPQENLPTAISYKVDGVLKVSNDVDITLSDDEGRVWMQIRSQAINDASSFIDLDLHQNDLGTGKTEMFYTKILTGINPMHFRMSSLNDPNFTVNVTRNDTQALSGTFSGTLWYDSTNGDDMPVQISEGSFYINR